MSAGDTGTAPSGGPAAVDGGSSSVGYGAAREIALGAVVPLLLVGVILFADVLEGPKTAYVGVLTFVPMLAAVFARPRITAAVGVVTWTAAFAFGKFASDGNVTAQQVRLVIIAISVVIATVAAGVRLRGDRELAAARVAAAQAEALRRQEHDAYVLQQEQERQRRIRAEVLAELTGQLDPDERAVDPVRVLVDVLVPRFAEVAVAERADGEELLATAGAAGAGSGVEELVGEFDGGGLGPLRLRVGRSEAAGSPFSDTDRSFLDQFTAQAGIALARRDVRARRQEIASELQRALLPTQLAARPGIEVAATYVAAGAMLDVGGDWYDSVELPDGRLLLVVGDVVGHGLEAAAVMGQLRSGAAALGTRVADPGELLVALDAFATGPGRTRYATVACAVIDPVSGTVEYASAGHPPLLAVGPDGSTTWLQAATSPPLATVRPATRSCARQQLQPGTTLMLYSDGLVEDRRTDIDAGLARLAAVAAAARHEPLDAFCQGVVDGLIGPEGFTDDVVVLAARLA